VSDALRPHLSVRPENRSNGLVRRVPRGRRRGPWPFAAQPTGPGWRPGVASVSAPSPPG